MQLAHPKVSQPKSVAFRPRNCHWSISHPARMPDGPAKRPRSDIYIYSKFLFKQVLLKTIERYLLFLILFFKTPSYFSRVGKGWKRNCPISFAKCMYTVGYNHSEQVRNYWNKGVHHTTHNSTTVITPSDAT